MSTPHWKTLDAYLAGTADAAQHAAVERWLEADPARREGLAALRSDNAAGRHHYDVNAAWLQLQAGVSRGPAAVPSSARVVQRRPQIIRIAASIVVVAGALSLWWSTRSSQVDVRPATLVTVATAAGERKDITLRDGSRVTLNAVSSITYDTSATGARDLTLDGEAYFEVRHDARRPFRVLAHGSVTEDVGTRFVVRAYRELPRTEVAVAEGMVRLARMAGDTSSHLLTAGQVGTLDAHGPPRVSQGAEGERYFGWMRGVLAFEGVPLRDAVPLLERRYGVSVALADSALANRRVFARFEHEPVEQAMDAIALALGAVLEKDGRTFTLSTGRR
jgi:transmembrane sensor